MKTDTAKTLGTIVGKILVLFISAGLLLWAWNKVAVPHFNAPILTYWEMFSIRVAFGTLGKVFTTIPDEKEY